MRPRKGLGSTSRHHTGNTDLSELTEEERLVEEERERAEEERKAKETREATEALHVVSVEIASRKMMEVLIRHIGIIDFEAKKDVAALFRDLLRAPCQDGFAPEYIVNNFDQIVGPLFEGYRLIEFSSFCCGQMLRECSKHAELTALILGSNYLDELFTAVKLEQFDIATDAFLTLQELLVSHFIVAWEPADT
jgi:calcium binding protein 39